MFENWIQFVISIFTLVVGIISAAAILKNITCKEIRAIQEVQCIMLQCHDVTLQALEKASKGEKCNGEISDQRRELQEFMIRRTTRGTKEEK
jgi:hypothetical protein